jgi:hypothetical protein
MRIGEIVEDIAREVMIDAGEDEVAIQERID